MFKFGIVSVLIMIVLSFGFPYWTAETTTITVVDKERIVDGSGSAMVSKYLVFSENEVFENTDCFARFKFNSSDVQGKLKVGNSYTVEVYGWRIPFFSMYRNIIEITE